MRREEGFSYISIYTKGLYKRMDNSSKSYKKTVATYKDVGHDDILFTFSG